MTKWSSGPGSRYSGLASGGYRISFSIECAAITVFALAFLLTFVIVCTVYTEQRGSFEKTEVPKR